MGYRRSDRHEDMTGISLFALAFVVAVSMGSVPDMAQLRAEASVPRGMTKAEFAAGLAEPLPPAQAAPGVSLASVGMPAPTVTTAPVPTSADAAVMHVALGAASAAEAAAAYAAPRVVQRPAGTDDQVRVVLADRLNIRATPDTGAPVLDQLGHGDFAQVVAQGPDGWLKIRLEGDGVEGWVAGRYLGYE